MKVPEEIAETLNQTGWEKLNDFLHLGFTIEHGDHNSKITVFSGIAIILTLLLTRYILRLITKFMRRKLSEKENDKFNPLFSFLKYFIYTIVGLAVVQSLGINLSPFLVASSALLVGIGLALQTFFQDILSGIFILIDKTVKIGDIIELDNQIGRVEEIKLRTTRAVTIDNKVLVIPNHKYLANSLYNWTQNGTITRDSVSVGVAYGTDTSLVKKILLQATNEHKDILKTPEPIVFFEDFGDSSLQFKVIYSINDSFSGAIPRSDLRFRIDELFRENKIEIPFPQRVIHSISS